jgi:hypothetical protein
MHWRVKGLVQKALSHIPGGVCLNDHLQQRFGALRHFERNVASKVEDWNLSIRYLQSVDFNVRDATLVEIGTGWYPTLPICFRLAGVKRVVSYDICRHMDATLTFRMLAELEGHIPSIAKASRTPEQEVQARYRTLLNAKDLDSLLKQAQLEYYAPTDARATSLLPNSVDLVFSNTVMQQVPTEVIRGLMRESMRILRPGGLSLHNVGCNDQYAFMDRRISFVNFLQYSESQWRKWNNSLQYQNRLRAPEFLMLAADAGLEVIYKQTAVRPGTREALATLEIAPEFHQFSLEDMAITTVDFISKKP